MDIKGEEDRIISRGSRNLKRPMAFLFAILIAMPAFALSILSFAAYMNITQSEIQAGLLYCREYPVSLKVAGQAIESDVPPVIIQGRTLVPVRALFEGIGADVSWDDADMQVDISMGDVEIKLTIDSRTAIVNGSKASLDVPALIIEDRTMIPVRFVAESLGFDVAWDNDTRTVEIEKAGISLSAVPVPEAGETVHLPAALTADNLVNPSRALQNFLNTCSGKTVIFPAGKTYVLEKQLVLHDVSNVEIDFNGCTFQLPNNCSIASRSDTGHYVPANTAMVVHDVSALTIRNYNINGNKANISTATWCTGLAVMNADGFTSINGSFRNCNYHHIVIGPTNVSTYNKNIEFKDTYFRDHGGAAGGAGISDVFVSNRSTDDFSFVGVKVDNTALKAYSAQAQCFYIAGHNGYFEDVATYNCAVPLDVRYGRHIAKDFTVTNAERVLMVQPYPGGNGGNGYAKLTASNFTGKNIKGGIAGGAAGLYIIGCEKCHINNFNIEMDPKSPYSWYGIRIRKYYSDYPIRDIFITNTKISNATVSNVLIEKMDASVILKRINATGFSDKTFGVKTLSCTAYQYVENLVTYNCIRSSSPDNMLVFL